MDKRKIENARVKKCIEDSFFSLLSEKSFSEITVTEIINRANVARTSYYRNFNCKEDIIKEYLNRLREEIKLAFDFSEKNYGEEISVHNLSIHISYYFKEKHRILLLYDNGLGTLLLDMANYFVEEDFGDMPYDSIDRYNLYFTSGAIFNVIIQWLKSGAKETPTEMAEIIFNYISKINK